MKVYRIRNKATGLWSCGGWNALNPHSNSWTSDPTKAKTWKRTSDVNGHLTAVTKFNERYAQDDLPTDWEVVVFEIKEEELQTYPLDKQKMVFKP